MASPDFSAPTSAGSAPAFGSSRRGYDRAAVDAYVASTTDQLAALSDEVARLRTAVAAAERAPVRLSDRAGELLRSADSRAAEAIEFARAGESSTAELYERCRADCEAMLTAAQLEADRVLAEARHRADTLDERARQEHAWRRRQVRKEQELVDLRKQQIVSQIVTLSALAAKTAQSPIELDQLGAVGEPGELDEPAAGGDRSSSGLAAV